MLPIFIAGAAVVGLPILLHLLLRQQPKKLVFPALRFLKQRQKTSQRRVQLRHIILLLLRCLLLALFALALIQPKIDSVGGINLSGEEPIAAVIIIDTSPSMGYRDGTTRLEEARRRAADLLNELPPRSRVAVLSTHDPSGNWQPTVLEARQRLDELKEPTGSARSLGPALERAYGLFKDDEVNPAGQEPLPRLVAVFGDRTFASWDAKETSGLAAKRDAVPQPAPVHLFFDVGVDRPVNLAVADLRMESDRLAGATDAVLTALIRADGPDVNELVVTAQLDEDPSETTVLNVPGGSTVPTTFTFKAPRPGFHTVTVKLGREDLLPFDNERTFTFEVQPRRSILAVADDPADADFWRLSHNVGKQEFDCTVVTPDKLPPLGGYEMVAVIAVADPGPMAEKLTEYVKGGGKLLLAPDGPGSEADAKRPEAYEKLGDLLPARLGTVKELKASDGKTVGVPWKIDEEQDLSRSTMLAPLREWQKGNYDLFKSPRRVSKCRTLEPPVGAKTVYYADADAQLSRTPAVVEKAYDSGKGHVLLLTTRIDTAASNAVDGWNDYWLSDGHTWPTVFPWLVTKYLCDLGTEPTTTEAGGKRRYNFPTAAEVTLPTRGFVPPGERKVQLSGPGVSVERSKFTIPQNVAELKLTNRPKDVPKDEKGNALPPPPDEWWLEGDPLLTPGAFALQPEAADSPWQFHFSLAPPPAESDLSKVPAETIAELLGPDRVIRLDQNVSVRDYIEAKLNRPFELFPALVIGVLVFFAFEAVMANRFYKLK